MNPDQLAAIEEERRFLLRSLADLEAEHAAGDVDDHDYRELRDGYTVRAAATLRAIEDGRAALPARRRTRWTRRLMVVGAAAALVAAVSWVLAASFAERRPGAQITGADPRDERQVLLAQARAAQAVRPDVAADLYAQVLAADPDDVEALTYRGWSLVLTAGTLDDPEAVGEQVREGLGSLVKATELDPAYPDPHCFLAITLFNQLYDAEQAKPHVDQCLALGPPADVRGLVEGLQSRIDAALVDG